MFGETTGRGAAPRHRVGAKLRSDKQYLGIERSLQRAWAKGAGLIDEELERPMVAVVNTWQDFSPENVHLPETLTVSGRTTGELVVTEQILARRRHSLSPMPPRVTRGYLKHYAEQVAPAAEGAVMPR